MNAKERFQRKIGKKEMMKLFYSTHNASKSVKESCNKNNSSMIFVGDSQQMDGAEEHFDKLTTCILNEYDSELMNFDIESTTNK